MARMDNDDVADVLNGLIRLDFDAIEAYEAAIRRADDQAIRSQLAEFLQDHQRHTVNLAEEVRRLGEKPVDGPGLMRMLTEGAVVIGGLGHDRGVLKAMSTNEAVTNRSYEQALEKLADHPVANVVRQNREDERRHKQWIDSRLQELDMAAVDRKARDKGVGGSDRPRDLR